jgi:hypothetical protein
MYVSLMHELKKTGKVFTSKFAGTGPSSYKKRIYRTTDSQSLRNTGLRRRSSAARLLNSWVRIPAETWMLVVNVVNCQVEVYATD